MSVSTADIDALQAQVDDLRARHEASSSSSDSVSSDPDVQAAGVELAQAVSRALGIDMPLQVADGSSLPVVELPREFVEQGGVGVAVVVASPPGS